jgi:excisionase family DNA binding protein
VKGEREESIRALATVTLDARALEELGPRTIDRLADLVEARLVQRRAAGAEPLLTAAAAAEFADVNVGTVHRAIKDGAMEVAGYVGRRPRVRREAVEQWIAAGQGRALAPPPVGRTVIARRRGPVRRVLGDALRELGSGERVA